MDNIFIEHDKYKEIHKLLPLVCVDILVVIDNKLVLVKRAQEPAAGEWWFIGGRVYKNEKLIDAVARITKAELGLEAHNPISIGYDETIFSTDPFGHGCGTHTINIIYLVITDGQIQLDCTSTEFKLIPLSDIDQLPNYYLRKHAGAAVCEIKINELGWI